MQTCQSPFPAQGKYLFQALLKTTVRRLLMLLTENTKFVKDMIIIMVFILKWKN